MHAVVKAFTSASIPAAEFFAADPLRTPPPFERLVGDLRGAYSRRINIQRRLVYQVVAEERVVKVLRMWTHYDG
jgi:toxin YoeB